MTSSAQLLDILGIPDSTNDDVEVVRRGFSIAKRCLGRSSLLTHIPHFAKVA
jgi:hypothetical protein